MSEMGEVRSVAVDYFERPDSETEGAARERPRQTVSCVQVKVEWGDATLHVAEIDARVDARSSFTVGEARGVDFVVPLTGSSEPALRLVRFEHGSAIVELPHGVNGWVRGPEGQTWTFDSIGERRLRELALEPGSSVRFRLGHLELEIAALDPEPRMPRSFGADLSNVLAYFGVSALSTGALLFSMAYWMPPLGTNAGEKVDAERLYLMQQYLESAAEREQKPEPSTSEETETSGGREGAPATGSSGAMGKPETTSKPARMAVKGTAHESTPRIDVLAEARAFGMIGILSGGVAHAALSAPWERDLALGSDPMDARGNLWSDELGDAPGSGLGLLGTAEGGGGKYQGIGLGQIETIGSFGKCTGADCTGFGPGFSRGTGPGHKTRSPRMRMSQPIISGRLPKETIQRIVRQNFGQFRYCYEQGLTRNPNLEGRVSVRFLISSQGSVSSAGNGGSSLPDAAVVNCVVRAFYGLGFPRPEHGSVQVTYPIMFSPN